MMGGPAGEAGGQLFARGQPGECLFTPSYLQLRALSALRADQAPGEAGSDERLLLLTVSGIAAGLQNTG